MPSIEPIAHIYNDFTSKFGIPRQSGMVNSLRSKIVFEHEYRNPDALRGLERFSHIWLIWGFSQTQKGAWSPTVRPPRLGGNERVGVFASRSPFRPNSLGLSLVGLDGIELSGESGPVVFVLGADMMNATPIYDIKPYLPYAECRPEALGGFTQERGKAALRVEIPPECSGGLPGETLGVLYEILANDPRPAYHDDPARIYGMPFGGYDIRFSVANGVLTVHEIVKLEG